MAKFDPNISAAIGAVFATTPTKVLPTTPPPAAQTANSEREASKTLTR